MRCSCHAHRRTFATAATEARILKEVEGRLLNHTQLSITGLYYIKLSLDTLRPTWKTCVVNWME